MENRVDVTLALAGKEPLACSLSRVPFVGEYIALKSAEADRPVRTFQVVNVVHYTPERGSREEATAMAIEMTWDEMTNAAIARLNDVARALKRSKLF